MRGMLSVGESDFPSFFILVPPDMVHHFLFSKGGQQGEALADDSGAASRQTKVESKGVEVYFLCMVCQLTGRVMHEPIKLSFPGPKATAFLKKAATPMKIAFALLTLGIVVAKVATGGVVPIPSSFPLSIEKIAEIGEMLDRMSGTGANVIAYSEMALEGSELGEAVRTHPLLRFHNLSTISSVALISLCVISVRRAGGRSRRSWST
jgi:hypothetical protein